MALPEHLPYIDRALTAYHADIGTASSAYVYCPFNGRSSRSTMSSSRGLGRRRRHHHQDQRHHHRRDRRRDHRGVGLGVRRARHHHAGRDQRHRGRRRLHRAHLRRRAVERIPGDVDHRGAGRLIRRRRMTMQQASRLGTTQSGSPTIRRRRSAMRSVRRPIKSASPPIRPATSRSATARRPRRQRTRICRRIGPNTSR